MSRDSLPSTYTERLIAYVDVLGFGSLIAESGQSDLLAPEIIKRISEAIDWSIEELSVRLHSTADIVFTQFSDSFVVSVDAEAVGKYGLTQFSHCLLVVIDCFLSSRLLLRGGISRGKLIHTATLLFGPAMNRAYELESRFARVPRIVLDPVLSELPQLVLHDRLAQDADGLWYVDYLTPSKMFYLVPSWQHTIQRTIEAMPCIPALTDKRAWLTEKYNHAIEGFSYEMFKLRLDEYVNDDDANNAVVANYEELLAPARLIRRL